MLRVKIQVHAAHWRIIYTYYIYLNITIGDEATIHFGIGWPFFKNKNEE